MVTINEEVMKAFAFWGSVLVLKMLAMVPITGRHRFGKRIFANPEDAEKLANFKVCYDDPDIERVRRAHRNDLENILPWFMITCLWLTTGPSVWLAKNLIRAFVIMRILYTYVYAIHPQQPARLIVFLVAFFIMIYEAVATLFYYV